MKALSMVATVILLLVFLGFILLAVSPQARDLANEVLHLGDALLGEDIVTLSQAGLRDFVAEYQACKLSADVACVCPFASFQLPKGAFVEVTNTPSTKFTSLKLYQGSVETLEKVAYGKLLSGVSENAGDNPFVENDLVLVPTRVPDRSVSYLDGQGRFDLSAYVSASKVFVVPVSPRFKAQTPLDAVASSRFNLRGLYKVDGEQMAFIPSPDAALNIVGNPDQKELAKVQGLQHCRLAPDGVQQLLVNVKQKLEDCRASKRIAPFACAPFAVDIPAQYVVGFDAKRMVAREIVADGEKEVAQVALPYEVCNAPVYEDADLARFVPDGREVRLSSAVKAASVVVVQGRVCLHLFSEVDVLQGKLEAFQRASQPLFGA